jgi:pSer/pThr/pTyr-binding forkhead associated (FHA) protein
VGDLYLDHLPLVLGRTTDCNISLPVTFVSRRHCQFFRRGDAVLVQDLESLNGTFVNGCRVEVPTVLHHGDELRFGPLPFRVAFIAEDERRKAGPTTPFEMSWR